MYACIVPNKWMWNKEGESPVQLCESAREAGCGTALNVAVGTSQLAISSLATVAGSGSTRTSSATDSTVIGDTYVAARIAGAGWHRDDPTVGRSANFAGGR
ncbi:hypothetical protein KM043_013653 [Ampulex compressa]|nr:hypothetical protein KM043_013653 [Ampulex compressa]